MTDRNKKRKRASSRNIISSEGMVADNLCRPYLESFPVDFVNLLRKKLFHKIKGLHEKFNTRSRYFGYRMGGPPDKAYIYVQKKKLVLDLLIPEKLREELFNIVQRAGITVKTRMNFQGHAGWITGCEIPNTTPPINKTHLSIALELIGMAFNLDLNTNHTA